MSHKIFSDWGPDVVLNKKEERSFVCLSQTEQESKVTNFKAGIS